MSTDWPGGFYTYEDPEQSAVRGRYGAALYPEVQVPEYRAAVTGERDVVELEERQTAAGAASCG